MEHSLLAQIDIDLTSIHKIEKMSYNQRAKRIVTKRESHFFVTKWESIYLLAQIDVALLSVRNTKQFSRTRKNVAIKSCHRVTESERGRVQRLISPWPLFTIKRKISRMRKIVMDASCHRVCEWEGECAEIDIDPTFMLNLNKKLVTGESCHQHTQVRTRTHVYIS